MYTCVKSQRTSRSSVFENIFTNVLCQKTGTNWAYVQLQKWTMNKEGANTTFLSLLLSANHFVESGTLNEMSSLTKDNIVQSFKENLGEADKNDALKLARVK